MGGGGGFSQVAQSQTSKKHVHQSLEHCLDHCKCFPVALHLTNRLMSCVFLMSNGFAQLFVRSTMACMLHSSFSILDGLSHGEQSSNQLYCAYP